MTTFKGFTSLVLAAATFITLSAEMRCPGNVASVPLQVVNRHQFLIDVSINQSGPYSFLFDTGTQITIVTTLITLQFLISGRRMCPSVSQSSLVGKLFFFASPVSFFSSVPVESA